jgi:hypothetical protein
VLHAPTINIKNKENKATIEKMHTQVILQKPYFGNQRSRFSELFPTPTGAIEH